jgi:hypothetical protein
MDIENLFKKLKRTPYSKKTVKKFKNVVTQLETRLRKKRVVRSGIVRYNITPYEYFLKIQRKKKCVIDDYLMVTNNISAKNKKKFKFNSKNPKIKLKRCKSGDTIIPMNIKNIKKGGKVKYHFNIIVVKNKKAYRIDASEPCGTKIFEENVRLALTKYFEKRSVKYMGLHKNSKVIRHGGLCRYVTPLEYFYKNINYNLIKKNIIAYFKYLIYESN